MARVTPIEAQSKINKHAAFTKCSSLATLGPTFTHTRHINAPLHQKSRPRTLGLRDSGFDTPPSPHLDPSPGVVGEEVHGRGHTRHHGVPQEEVQLPGVDLLTHQQYLETEGKSNKAEKKKELDFLFGLSRTPPYCGDSTLETPS